MVRVVYSSGVVEYILYIAAAYLMGAVPFGYIAGRMRGIDLREHGSHNIGATNAVRVLGKKWGIPVFLCDALKGFLPLWWVKTQLGGDLSTLTEGQMAILLAVMLAPVLGHTYTCFLGFRGGKGVATMAGCLAALSPFVVGMAAAGFVLSMAITRYVSLSSLVAGVVMVAAAAWEFYGSGGVISPAEYMALGALVLVLVLVVWKHRANIGRILHGTEPKAFSKKK